MQELNQKPKRNADYWFVPHGLINLLSYASQDYLPSGGTTQNGLGPLMSIINQENALD